MQISFLESPDAHSDDKISFIHLHDTQAMSGSTLRSTERSLKLISLRKLGRHISLQKLQTRSTGSLFKRHPIRIGPSILLPNTDSTRAGEKFGQRQIRLLSDSTKKAPESTTTTTKPKFQLDSKPSLLNPNKPDAIDLKENQLQPIVPLTYPRFLNNSGDVPSVTRVLQATMPASSQFMLDKWRESMIKKLGMAGFNQYQKETFERGRMLHALLANFLLGRGEPVLGEAELSKEIVCNLWKSIEGVLRDKISNVRLVEHIVTHSEMNYRGIVDCVAFYNDELVVIDFKTAEKPKKNVESLYDNPLQVTAYCGAINNDESIPRHVIDRNISAGLVIVAYIDGSEASTYHLPSAKVSQTYWKQWTTRLEQFTRLEELKSKKNRDSKS